MNGDTTSLLLHSALPKLREDLSAEIKRSRIETAKFQRLITQLMEKQREVQSQTAKVFEQLHRRLEQIESSSTTPRVAASASPGELLVWSSSSDYASPGDNAVASPPENRNNHAVASPPVVNRPKPTYKVTDKVQVLWTGADTETETSDWSLTLTLFVLV